MHTKDGQHGGDDDGKHVLSSECRKGARQNKVFELQNGTALRA